MQINASCTKYYARVCSICCNIGDGHVTYIVYTTRNEVIMCMCFHCIELYASEAHMIGFGVPTAV